MRVPRVVSNPVRTLCEKSALTSTPFGVLDSNTTVTNTYEADFGENHEIGSQSTPPTHTSSQPHLRNRIHHIESESSFELHRSASILCRANNNR